MSQKPISKKTQYNLAFMPGAGGNFLSRCLNFHPDINCFVNCIDKNYSQKYEILNYKSIKNRRVPESQNWLEFEKLEKLIKDNKNYNSKNVIAPSHTFVSDCDIRITNYSKKEFDWARYQALFKNTVFCLSWLKSGQINDQKVSVPCKNLWDFNLLSESLIEIEEYIRVEKNINECRVWQKKLWEEWRLTWAPKEIGKVVDQYYYGPKD